MSIFIKLASMAVGLWSGTKNKAGKCQDTALKRVIFAVTILVSLWFIISPESAGLRLESAADNMPGWLQALLASIVAGEL